MTMEGPGTTMNATAEDGEHVRKLVRRAALRLVRQTLLEEGTMAFRRTSLELYSQSGSAVSPSREHLLVLSKLGLPNDWIWKESLVLTRARSCGKPTLWGPPNGWRSAARKLVLWTSVTMSM